MSDVREARSLTVKGAATRERILAAAVDLMAVHGVAGTSTDDVRRAAGVSGSQLYHYFDDRQALIRAVITRQADAASAGVALELGALDSMEALRAWADAAIERQRQTLDDPDCDLSTLAGELHAADESSRQEIATGFLRWKATLTDGLTMMRDRGDLREDADLNELASALLGALQGGQMLARTLGDVSGLSAPLNAALVYVQTFVLRS